MQFCGLRCNTDLTCPIPTCLFNSSSVQYVPSVILVNQHYSAGVILISTNVGHPSITENEFWGVCSRTGPYTLLHMERHPSPS